jgi:hypothetical protein
MGRFPGGVGLWTAILAFVLFLFVLFVSHPSPDSAPRRRLYGMRTIAGGRECDTFTYSIVQKGVHKKRSRGARIRCTIVRAPRSVAIAADVQAKKVLDLLASASAEGSDRLAQRAALGVFVLHAG